MNYNEFEWLITMAGGIKEPEKCKIIPKNKQPIDESCMVSKNLDQVFRQHDIDGDRCLDFYEYKWLFQCSKSSNRWSMGNKKMWEWILKYDTIGEPDCCLSRAEAENSIKALGWFRG